MKILFSILLYALFIQAQERYSQVKIPVHSINDFKRIVDLGIAVDHFNGKVGKAISVFLSERELQQLDNAGIQYTYIIKDWDKFYTESQKSKKPSLQKIQLAAPKNFRYGMMGGFLTYAEVLQQLDSMKLLYPSLITIKDSIGFTIEGRAIYALKISDNPSTNESAEPEVLYTALHHAREPQGMMSVIYYMWWLLENYGTDPEATYLVNNRQMWFIPVVNPDGYVYNETIKPNGGGMWRKNRKDNGNGTFGIDLNRNYGPEYMWNAPNGGSSTSPSSETYRGTTPFSEPETQTISSFIRSHKIKTCFNYHTYSNLLIYPWGYASKESHDSLLFRDWAFDLTTVNRYASGTDLQTVLYSTRGNSDDFMFGDTSDAKLRTYAMTPEVGIYEYDTLGTYGFWPMQSKIIPLAEENLQANKYLAFIAGEYLSVEASTHNASKKINIKNKGLDESQTHSLFFQTSDGVVTPSTQINKIFPQTSDSIAFTFEISNAAKSSISKIYIKDELGGAMINDSIMFYPGQPTTLFFDSANTISQWSTGSGWTVVNDDQLNSKVFTDSPDGKYLANANNALSLLLPVDLSIYQYAELKFKTKWSIEPTWDFGVVEISTNNGVTWNSLKTQHARKGSSRFESKQPEGSYGYDAYSPLSGWIEETADISHYAGEKITLRFRLTSDAGEQRDGWYIDDIQIVGYHPISLSVNEPITVLSFELYQNYPNPFNPVTRINYGIPHSSFVTLYVYDVLGRKITTLVNRYAGAGKHEVLFDASRISSGVYFYRLTAGSYTSVRTMTVVK